MLILLTATLNGPLMYCDPPSCICDGIIADAVQCGLSIKYLQQRNRRWMWHLAIFARVFEYTHGNTGAFPSNELTEVEKKELIDMAMPKNAWYPVLRVCNYWGIQNFRHASIWVPVEVIE